MISAQEEQALMPWSPADPPAPLNLHHLRCCSHQSVSVLHWKLLLSRTCPSSFSLNPPHRQAQPPPPPRSVQLCLFRLHCPASPSPGLAGHSFPWSLITPLARSPAVTYFPSPAHLPTEEKNKRFLELALFFPVFPP